MEQGLTADQMESAEKMVSMFSGPVAIVLSIVVLGVLGAVIGMVAAAIFKRGEGVQ